MESMKRCTVIFVDGKVTVIEAEKIKLEGNLIIAYMRESIVGVFNQCEIAAAYLTVEKK